MKVSGWGNKNGMILLCIQYSMKTLPPPENTMAGDATGSQGFVTVRLNQGIGNKLGENTTAGWGFVDSPIF